jgi:hypothetical protein
MINDERAEKALRYLAISDESCAAAKANQERMEYKAKAVRQQVFLIEEGTVAERQAKAEVDHDHQNALEEYFDAMKTYSAIANKRETERIVLDTWRTISANRRSGA